MKKTFFSIALSAILVLSFVFVACNRNTKEIQPSENAAKQNTRNNKNGSSNLFDELRSSLTSYFEVTNAKYESIKQDNNLVQAHINQLNTYAQTAPENIDIASVANTKGFSSETAYVNAINRIKNASLAVKNAYSNLSNEELLDIIKLELNPIDPPARVSCWDIYDAEITTHAATAALSTVACTFSSVLCGPWAAGCLLACGSAVISVQIAADNESYVKYLACIEKQ